MTLTNEQKAIIDNERTVKYVRLEFPNTEIADIGYDQIYQESLSLEESLCEDDNLKFGKCNSSLFKIKVADFTDDIDGLDMDVYITFTNEDLGTVELPFGKYTVQAVERTSDRRWRDITAVDYMSKFDIDVSDWYINTMFINKDATYTLKEFREALYNYIGVEYEDVTLPNDETIIKKSISPTTLLARELLENICELNGCYGHFDWTGTLRFISLDINSTTETINQYPQDGCEYKDYDTRFVSAVIAKDEEGNDVANYPQTIGTYNYTIENNILLFGMSAFDQEWVCTRLYNAIRYIGWRPSKTKVYSKIYMPLGQRILVRAKTYNGTTEVDTSFYTYMLKREIQGIQSMFSTIESPEITENKSSGLTSEIKSIQNRLNVVKEDVNTLNSKIQYYILYDNEEPYFVDDNETIIEIAFKTFRKGYIIFHSSVIFNLETIDEEVENIMNFNDGDVLFQFVVNDDPILGYVPRVTYQDGTYTIHLDYSYYNEIENETIEQTFKVVCTVNNCEVSIPTYKIHGYLTSDGLYVSGWDGRIIAEDEFENIELDMTPSIRDTYDVTVRNENMRTYTQILSNISLDGIVPTITDSIGQLLGMIFSTVVNLNLLTYTATISNNTFVAGEIITPKIHNINSVSVISRGDVSFAVSFDSGTTWNEYANGQWVPGATMTKAEIESVPNSAWVGDAMIKAIIADDDISNLTQIVIEGGILV